MKFPQPHSAHEETKPRAALEILEERTQAAQDELAQRDDVGAALLQYLAENGAPATRRAVAANIFTPASANRLLADDEQEEVRTELAVKIARIMPGLSQHEGAHFCALTIETLECLARDCAVRVRAILADEIKHLDCIPRSVVQILARDAEMMVATPILEYSPLLSDQDLMEIVTYAHVNEVLTAVARRKNLSARISDVVVASLDIPAIAALLLNSSAEIRAKTLNRIINDAENIDEWHGPLALRSDLSARAIRRVAAFVGANQIEQLAARHGLNEAMRAHLNRQLRARLGADENRAHAAPPESAAMRVAIAQQSGKLDDLFLEKAIRARQRETVILALAELAKAPSITVHNMLISGTAKPIVSLVWHAGLSMRIAFKIQGSIMKLPAHELLPARGGIGFPLSEAEMRWHLDYFGITT